MLRNSIAGFILFAVLLAACAPVPDLWGELPTPTASYDSGIQSLEPAALQIRATPTILAPASPSPQPTVSPSVSSSPIPAAGTSGPETATPASTESNLAEATYTPTFDVPAVLYYAQSGDSVPAVAARFGIAQDEIHSDGGLQDSGFIPPGKLLIMPDRISDPTSPGDEIIPDSELVFSGTAVDFDIDAFVRSAGGKLSTQREYLGSTGWTTGSEAIKRLAYENSINPRLLLAVLEYESRWVRGDAVDAIHRDYPMGYINLYYRG
ncbi:MAG TPA: hypothetical protein VFH29_09460, partial [Anaerolineales bacterium]|nr:hypothetical protein [Anaerolineales bacterium]